MDRGLDKVGNRYIFREIGSLNWFGRVMSAITGEFEFSDENEDKLKESSRLSCLNCIMRR